VVISITGIFGNMLTSRGGILQSCPVALAIANIFGNFRKI